MRIFLRRLRRRACDERGVTLTELLVVLNLLGVVIGAGYMMLSTVSGMADTLEARSIASDDTRRLVDRITRELRQAQEIEDGEGAFDSAQPRRCAFYCDVDHDGTPELVTYRVVGKNLYRSEAKATTAVPPYSFESGAEELIVGSLDGGWNGNVFEYYDREDPPRPVPSGHTEDVSAVRFRLVNSATVGRKTAFVDLSTWVKVRAVHSQID